MHPNGPINASTSAHHTWREAWHQRWRAPHSIRVSLTALVLTCVLPATVLWSVLAYVDYQQQRDRIYGEALRVAQNLRSDLDRELTSVESALRILATSSELAAGDLPGFHRRAVDALKFQIGNNFVLSDRDGRQHINTLLPFGPATPARIGPVLMRPVFESGNPYLTGLFESGIGRTRSVAMGVPVFKNQEVVFSLNAVLAPEHIGEALRRKRLPEGWIAAVLDGDGSIVARTRDSERFVGQKATPSLLQRALVEPEGTFESVTKDGVQVFTAFTRSGLSSWTVAVGAPKQVLVSELNRAMAWQLLGAVLAMGLGLWAAGRLARRVSSSVQSLIDPALALGSGRPVELQPTRLKEVQSVGQALVQAQRMLQHAQHQAHHDALTGLCNRVLFDEVAAHELATARRHQTGCAVLMIDLDGFKAVNDQQGHAAGDLVLKLAAERIRASIRASDVAARIGGDEFAVLLGDADASGAQHIADKLVEALAAPYADVLAPVSASIGLALYPQAGVGLTELLAAADGALYAAKAAGKRRSAMAG